MENKDTKEIKATNNTQQANPPKQSKQVTKNICTWMIYIIAHIIALSIVFHKGRNVALNELDILYISQAEILSLEKKRASDVSDDQLFFGKPEAAIKHIEKLQKEMSQKGHYVLLTDSKIYGSNVRSISKQIHQQIVERLGEDVE